MKFYADYFELFHLWLLISSRETSELSLFVFVGIINDPFLCVITSTSPLTSGRQSSIAITPYGLVVMDCVKLFPHFIPSLQMGTKMMEKARPAGIWGLPYCEMRSERRSGKQ